MSERFESALKDVRRAIASLDLTDEQAQIAELQAKIERNEEAIQKAETRCTEIARARMSRERDGERVADALLTSGSATDSATMAPSVEVMAEEHASLRAGITSLRRRSEGLAAEIRGVQAVAQSKASAVVAPLVAAVMDEQRRVAEELCSGHAAIFALQMATGAFAGDEHATKLAVEGVIGPSKLVKGRRDIPVPKEITEALQPLLDHRPALQPKILGTALLY